MEVVQSNKAYTPCLGVLTNVLVYKGEENGKNYKPSKKLLKKINRDVDYDFMYELMFALMKDKMPVDFLEENYDRLFLLPDYLGDKSARRKFENSTHCH